MKQLIKGALIGAICGVAAPVGLAVANEVLFAHNKYNDVTAARICFAERTWSLFRLDIKYAKGCKNGLLDSVPLCLVIGVLGGSLIGAMSLTNRRSATKTPTLTSKSSSSEPENTPSARSILAEAAKTNTNNTGSMSGNIIERIRINSGLSGSALPLMLGITVVGVGVVVAYQGGLTRRSNSNADPELTDAAVEAGCTAESKPGQSPYSHYKANTPISFHSYGMYQQSSASPPIKHLVGERLLTIPVSDLKNLSAGCSKLKEYIGD